MTPPPLHTNCKLYCLQQPIVLQGGTQQQCNRDKLTLHQELCYLHTCTALVCKVHCTASNCQPHCSALYCTVSQGGTQHQWNRDDDEDEEFDVSTVVVVGTCSTLEKQYFRQVPFASYRRG